MILIFKIITFIYNYNYFIFNYNIGSLPYWKIAKTGLFTSTLSDSYRKRRTHLSSELRSLSICLPTATAKT